ncbi:MAG: DUF4168 domain-containing protein [Cellvibrionaceae bacterium]
MSISKMKSILVLFGLTLVAFGAHAQQQPAPPPEPGFDSTPSEPVDDQTVEQFAAAYSSVQSIQEEFTERLQEADDREQAQSLQQEAQQQMLSTVEENGLSVQQYNEMIARMDQDPELRQRVFDLVAD